MFTIFPAFSDIVWARPIAAFTRVAEAARRLAETQADLAEAHHRVAEAWAILVQVNLVLKIQFKA